MEDKLKLIIATILDINPEDIDENSCSDTVEKWDSLKQMNLVVAIEEQFGLEFDEEEVVLLSSYGLLLEAIKRKVNFN